MSTVVPLGVLACDISARLRNLADQIDAGLEVDMVQVIVQRTYAVDVHVYGRYDAGRAYIGLSKAKDIIKSTTL